MRTNSYELPRPRGALALISVATAALTMGAMVFLPAWIEFADVDGSTLLAASKTAGSIDGPVIGEHCANEPIPESRHPAFDMHARATRALSMEQR